MRVRAERMVAAGHDVTSIVEQFADRKITESGRLKLKFKAQPQFAAVLTNHNITTNARTQP